MRRMNIVNIPTGQIKPYAGNAKIHTDKQISEIAESIKRFGFRQPIVIDADGVIVAGHGRFLAAQKLGLQEVPCERADDLTAEEIAAYRLADNKTNESEWDLSKLDEELKALDSEGFEMSDLGFDMEAIGGGYTGS